MSQNDIRIYDDTVLKLTVKQGSEKERFNVGSIGPNDKATHANGVEINITDYNSISTVPGSFTSGELAYTRDTNRLFVGNISPVTNKENKQQILGGVLTGNKYLGYIDSKPPYNIDLGRNNGIPLNLTVATENEGISIPGLLTDSSSFRSYEFIDSINGNAKITSDKKWSRLPYYNKTYDAYDGDFMYDIYRNALILFDHNIKPNTPTYGPTATSSIAGGRRQTPIKPREAENSDTALEAVTNHTRDMYGDGYVLLYNVIPDGKTLTFVDRSFDPVTGECNSANDSLKNNFSYNIIKVNKIDAVSIKDAFNPNHFILSDGGNTISLNPSVLIGSGSNSGIFEGIDPGTIITVDNNGNLKGSDYNISDLSKLNILNGLDSNFTITEYIENCINEKIKVEDLALSIKDELINEIQNYDFEGIKKDIEELNIRVNDISSTEDLEDYINDELATTWSIFEDLKEMIPSLINIVTNIKSSSNITQGDINTTKSKLNAIKEKLETAFTETEGEE